jgi:GDP-L-fucose synthase
LIVTNVYGPHKKIDDKQMHVIPALIEKFNQAKSNGSKSVQILGDGTPVREFLYSSDLGLAVHSFIENDLWTIPTMNIAGSEAVSILELAKIIANEMSYEGEILVEQSSNNGTSIKLLDDSIFRETGWEPRVDLAQGISNLSK